MTAAAAPLPTTRQAPDPDRRARSRPTRLRFVPTTPFVQVADNLESVRDADVIVLSTKPQSLPSVLPELRGALKPECLVITICPWL